MLNLDFENISLKIKRKKFSLNKLSDKKSIQDQLKNDTGKVFQAMQANKSTKNNKFKKTVPTE